MKKLVWLFLAVVLVFAACSSRPKTVAVEAPKYEEKTEAYVVLDHKAKAVGEDVPDWVTLYISDGLPGVERLDQFKDEYVFVGEDTGTNLNALRQWSSGFTVAQEMARMVSTRVQAKFVGAVAGSPDLEYGRYFEDVVKNVASASFSGARKENDYWLLKRYFMADGKTVDREAYDFYVLVTIDKGILERQINEVLDGTKTDAPLTREQQTAVERVKEAFYEGF
ncbi:MAG: hypothetical protein LBD78_02120 [Spirochaetaceae bacterium]|jgi:hypothetical protein|nr:hypothetical protein [Spirochaetaceae bacterium]